MNSVAEQALARARKRGNAASALSSQISRAATPAGAVAVVAVEPAPEPVSCHFSRVLYLEGRRHALDMVRDLRGLLELPGGAMTLTSRLSECMQEKPNSFAQGVAAVITLLETEVANG